MIRRTAWALLTNFNGSYIGLFVLALFTVHALATTGDGVVPRNLLMSVGLAAAALVGMLAGTTLTEIKVKPLSYVLPGQERSMAPAVLLVGVILCLSYALLLLGRPMTIISVPAWQQSLAAFCCGLGLFTLVVAGCVVTRDTGLSVYFTMLLFLLCVCAWWHEKLASAWISLSAAVAENAFAAGLFAACGVAVVFRVLSDRTRSRELCGAPFMPLKAYDNPFKTGEYRSRMRSSAFRPSVMTDSGASPGGLVMTVLRRRVIDTSWDYLVLDTRPGGTRWELTFKLVSIALQIAIVGVAGSLYRSPSALFVLFFIVFLTFATFPLTFRVRLSPMPPVSRRRQFRSFLAKGVTVYGLTILATLLLWLVVRLMSGIGIESWPSTLSTLGSLPPRAIVIVAASVPIMCWAYATLRSAIGFVVFMLAFVCVVGIVGNFAQAFLLAQSYPVLLLATAACWLPFVLIARKRCLKDDLLFL